MLSQGIININKYKTIKIDLLTVLKNTIIYKTIVAMDLNPIICRLNDLTKTQFFFT